MACLSHWYLKEGENSKSITSKFWCNLSIYLSFLKSTSWSLLSFFMMTNFSFTKRKNWPSFHGPQYLTSNAGLLKLLLLCKCFCRPPPPDAPSSRPEGGVAGLWPRESDTWLHFFECIWQGQWLDSVILKVASFALIMQFGLHSLIGCLESHRIQFI